MSNRTTRDTGPGPDLDRFHERDDLVERLLLLADRGPELPEGGAERVKQAVRPLWRREVRSRRRRGLMWQAGMAVAATAVVAFALAQWLRRGEPIPSGPAASLLRVVGEVAVTLADGRVRVLTDAEAGTPLEPGSWISTGEDARAALELAGGHTLRLDIGSRIRVDADRVIRLDRGAVYVDSGGTAPDGIEVHTALGVTRDIGTRFQVRAGDDRLVVSVRDGHVVVDRDCGAVEIGAGFALTVAADGTSSTNQIRPDGPGWAWTLEVAPSFAIEGRTAADFLGWVGGETGLTIRFADEASERLAANTVLHGSLMGLTPAQAPAVVLPSCGLGAQVVAGALVVRSMEGGDSGG